LEAITAHFLAKHINCRYPPLERGRITASNTTLMRYLLDTDWIINLLAGKKDTADYIVSADLLSQGMFL